MFAGSFEWCCCVEELDIIFFFSTQSHDAQSVNQIFELCGIRKNGSRSVSVHVWYLFKFSNQPNSLATLASVTNDSHLLCLHGDGQPTMAGVSGINGFVFFIEIFPFFFLFIIKY